MKKYLLTLSLFFVAALCHAQSLISCPDGINDTVLNRCSKTLTIPNPTLNSTSIVLVNYSMVGATNFVSPFVGMNYVGTKAFNTGLTHITYRVRTLAGQIDSCSFLVIIREFVPPTIKCPKDTVLYSPITSCFKQANLPLPTVADNCNPAFLYWSLSGATTGKSDTLGIYVLGAQSYKIGLTTAKYSVRDASYNLATCTFKIIVKDTLKPVVKCPANLLGYNKGDSCAKAIFSPKPTISDACGFASITWKMTGATVANSVLTGLNYVETKAYNPGLTTVTYSVKDKSANVSTCSYIVNVVDTVKPTIQNCPSSIDTKVTTGCSASVSIPTLSFKDNCGTPKLSWSLTGATVAKGIGQVGTQSFNIGATYVTDTVKDASGNIAICRFKVLVLDDIKPTIQCNASRIDTITSGCSKNITLPNPVFGDNCSKDLKLSWKLSGATLSVSPLTGINTIGTQNFKTGTTTCTYTLKDASSNSITCTFTVRVVELTKPVLTCGASQSEISTTSCTKDIIVNSPTFNDNCGLSTLTWKLTGATVLSSSTTGINIVGTKTFNKGITTVTYVAKDPSGNVSTCSSKVTLSVPVTCRGFARENNAITLSEEGLDNLNVKLIANPTHQNFTINTSTLKDEIVEVSVYTVNGKKIDQFKGMPNQIQKFGDKYSKGSYLIEVRQGNLRKTVTGIKM